MDNTPENDQPKAEETIESIDSEDPMMFVRREDVRFECPPREGDGQYVVSTHTARTIKVTLRVTFDDAPAPNETATVPPKSPVKVGCSMWRPDTRPPQYYIREIIKAEFV